MRSTHPWTTVIQKWRACSHAARRASLVRCQKAPNTCAHRALRDDTQTRRRLIASSAPRVSTLLAERAHALIAPAGSTLQQQRRRAPRWELESTRTARKRLKFNAHRAHLQSVESTLALLVRRGNLTAPPEPSAARCARRASQEDIRQSHALQRSTGRAPIAMLVRAVVEGPSPSALSAPAGSTLQQPPRSA